MKNGNASSDSATIKRLFVAIDFPDAVVDQLCEFLPRSAQGIRAVDRSQMHLTLHFIGDANVGEIAEHLETVSARSFALTVRGTGEFRGRDNSSILWVGIEARPELIDLHKKIADALAETDFVAESRPYSPHITLARCKDWNRGKQSPVRIEIERFLAAGQPLQIPDIPVREFGLWSSIAVERGREYNCERSYTLE
jgi:2'-5' RNA ligase